MKKLLLAITLFIQLSLQAQLNPAITHWMINTTGITGRHYIKNNSTPVNDTAQANVQLVQYSKDTVYISCSGIPAYVIGPYLDGNPSTAKNLQYTFRIPLNPVVNNGKKTPVALGITGFFINGVPIFNYSDARSYNNAGKWHQNAIAFENAGFDCAKGHPQQQGSYHHHQNPSAFNVAKVVNSNVCDVYLADGLYIPDSTQHGPLLGYSFDGFPIYGGYGYTNPTDTTSAIKRMVPAYRLRNITDRSKLPDGTLAAGPALGATVQNGPGTFVANLGAYAEDFELVSGLGDLDEYNGRFCKTPEYPNGIYCYFATVDAAGNSVFPYINGPNYYGVVPAINTKAKITEPVTIYTNKAPNTGFSSFTKEATKITIYPNPANDLLVIQSQVAANRNRVVELVDMNGKVLQKETLFQGSTMCYFDIQSLHAGTYIVRIIDGNESVSAKVVVGE